MTYVQSINPYNGIELERFSIHSDSQITTLLDNGQKAYNSWRKVPLTERIALISSVSQVMAKRLYSLAKLATFEMGKPIAQAKSEVQKCIDTCVYYCDNVEQLLAPFTPLGSKQALVRFEPIGPLLAIMPWNFPYWQVMRAAIPNILLGNTILLKHASNVWGCAHALASCFEEAGAMQGIFTCLDIEAETATKLIADPRVAAVTLTGSEGAGIAVGAAAGKALKKSVLELGGSDAFIVLKDADLQKAAQIAVKARTINNGQSCIAAKRFIVESPVYEEFVDLYNTHMQALGLGDPMDETTDIGPLAKPEFVKQVNSQVKNTLAMGAGLYLHNEESVDKDRFCLPGFLLDAPHGSPARIEELFAPMATIIKANNENDAIAIANETQFGLGSALFTTDLDKAHSLAMQIEAGTVSINRMTASTAELPFGGVKVSGYGRELSMQGLTEFANIKAVNGLEL